MSEKTCAILGVGNMGGAILRGCLRDSLFASKWTPLLIERDHDKIREFLPFNNTRHFSSLDELQRSVQLRSLDACLIAIKPQDAEEIVPLLTPLLKEDAIVISIMAGKSRSSISKLLGRDYTIVRAMPNLPIAIGLGMTVVHFDPSRANEEARSLTHALFQKSGKVLEAQHEDLLHPATALAGSGPGFLFHLFEAFVSEAIELGFSEVAAKDLAVQTIRGSVELYAASPLSLPELERQVTSPAGTTAAGIRVLKEENTQSILKKCIREASRRSAELAQPATSSPQVHEERDR